MSASVVTVLAVLALVTAQPDPMLTPGVVRPAITQAISCSTRWGLDRRAVTVAMKRHVAMAYGIAWADRGLYEFDHLVPRELGGADDVRNLWPQLWAGPNWAHRKDRLENALHRQVCAGTMTLREAQRVFLGNWITTADAMWPR